LGKKEIVMLDFDQLTSLVLDAGRLAREGSACKEAEILKKGESDFVTATDFAVQEMLASALAECCPDFRLIGEESDANDYSPNGRRFILDPIDGTTNFIHSFGKSAVSLACFDENGGLWGAVYDPFGDELFTAARGEGAYLNGKRIFCSSPAHLSDCLAAVELSPYYKDSTDLTFAMVRTIFERTCDVRVIGSAALGMSYVACGRCDLFVSRLLKPWDYAAASILISEAGGRTADFSKNALPTDRLSDVVAAGTIFEELCMLVEPYQSK
jgi:myo-inositol-1(or 4)-monophosphatase